MCLAIFKPAKAVIPTEHLLNGYQSNSDGCGFVYPEGGKLHIVKGLFTFKEFLDMYREKEENPMLIHFRWATHGDANFINCHPFSICDGKFAMIHNGVIHICQSIPELSDTGNFAKLVMEPLLKDGVHPSKPAFRFLVENAIGNNNKVALMSSNGNVTIYNEDEGNHEPAIDSEGRPLLMTVRMGKDTKRIPAQVWYSNACYRNIRRRAHAPQDELNGYFDGPPNVEADVALPPEFHGPERAKLDAPPGIITGFRPLGINANDAKSSAEAIIAADGANSQSSAVRTPGKYPPNVPAINLNETANTSAADKVKVNERPKADNIKGPVFSAKVELEINYLERSMNMERAEAIAALQLAVEDAVVYVD